jgi:hypothetical protein
MQERGGLQGVYAGARANVVRSLMSWGIINASYGFFKQHLRLGRERQMDSEDAKFQRQHAGAGHAQHASESSDDLSYEVHPRPAS